MMKKKIQKIYDAVFEIPLISLPQINIGGNIENNIVIENGYLSTYYQNTTKNIQNIIIKGTANPYIYIIIHYMVFLILNLLLEQH